MLGFSFSLHSGQQGEHVVVSLCSGLGGWGRGAVGGPWVHSALLTGCNPDMMLEQELI